MTFLLSLCPTVKDPSGAPHKSYCTTVLELVGLLQGFNSNHNYGLKFTSGIFAQFWSDQGERGLKQDRLGNCCIVVLDSAKVFWFCILGFWMKPMPNYHGARV